MTMENKKSAPAIRFKRFTGNWRSKRFDKTFSMLCNNTLSRAALSYEKGSTKNVHYGDVLIKFGEYTDVTREDIPYISDDKIADKYITSRLQDGDIVFADTAEDATAGKCTELFNVQQQPIISGLHTIPCRPLFPFSTSYLGYFLNSSAYHNQLLPLMQGTKVVGISKTAIKDTCVSFPEDADEQRAIGNYFQDIDKLINTSQTKLDKLKNIKKACLEKMFSRKGSNTPELRFKGFKKTWKEKKLEDIVDVRSGRDYKHLVDGNIPVYGTGGYMLSVNAALSYDENAVGIGRKGTIDKPYILYAPFWTVDTLFYAVPRKNNYLNFIYNLFQQVDWRKKDESTGVPSLSKVAINSIVINTAGYTEQQIIGVFFENLDDIIVKIDKQINKLKNIKKACLDKMFVTGED